MKKKLLPAVVVLLVVIAVGAYLASSLRAKREYDKARTALAEHVLSAVPMDAETESLLTEVQTSWGVRFSEVGGPFSDALTEIGLEPSVSNVIELLTYRMPEYSLVSRGRNVRPAQIGLIQAVVLPTSVDKSIHLSDDHHVALIRILPTLVEVFTDDVDGLRCTEYYARKENLEPGDE